MKLDKFIEMTPVADLVADGLTFGTEKYLKDDVVCVIGIDGCTSLWFEVKDVLERGFGYKAGVGEQIDCWYTDGVVILLGGEMMVYFDAYRKDFCEALFTPNE